MERNEVFQQLKSIFEDILDELEVELTEKSQAENVEEWDSLTHIQIITEIEKQFELTLTTREIEALKDIGDMVSLIHSKLAVV